MRYLGIDGGGTKTAFSIYDEQFCLLDRFELNTCHYAQVGLEGMRQVLLRGIERARSSGLMRDDFGIGFGICGYGENAQADAALREVCALAAEGHPYALVNDVEAAWAAGLDCADGIALIAGTGSIALGVRGDTHIRCGGWDFEIGDEGSGGWMGKQALTAFTRQADGRDARGALYELLRDELRLHHDFDIIERARELLADRTACAALSRLVTQAAAQGDASARRIFEQAAREEADLVAALVRQLFASSAERSVPVTYIGGTFRAGDAILAPLASALPPCCYLSAPVHEADLGAVLILDRQETCLPGRSKQHG